MSHKLLVLFTEKWLKDTAIFKTSREDAPPAGKLRGWRQAVSVFYRICDFFSNSFYFLTISQMNL
jgi:hypothetical protein